MSAWRYLFVVSRVSWPSQRDGRDIDRGAGVQEAHGGRVSQGVRGDVLGGERRAAACSDVGVLGNQPPDGAAGEVAPTAVGEQRSALDSTADGQVSPSRDLTFPRSARTKVADSIQSAITAGYSDEPLSVRASMACGTSSTEPPATRNALSCQPGLGPGACGHLPSSSTSDVGVSAGAANDGNDDDSASRG